MPTIEDAIRRTLDAVETVAPKAWQAAVQYERVDAITGLVQAAFILAFAIVGYSFCGKVAQKADGEGRAILRVFSAILLALAILGTASAAISDVSQLLNAETFAARRLMDGVRH
jgi:hypothetical protein